MYIPLDEIIEKVAYDDSLTSEEKSHLIKRVKSASYGIQKYVTPDLYFTADFIDKKVQVALIGIQIDVATGVSKRFVTNYDSDTIVDLLKKEWLNKENGKRL